MKEEIKEILELYKNDDIEYYNLVSDLGYDKLLDCITDLLDTLKDREEYCYGLETHLDNLQEENEELKKNQRYYKNGVFSLEYDKETMSDIIDEYKQRNEKAIEYINNHQLVFELSNKKQIQYWFDMFYIDLLNILKGDKDK